VKFKNISRWKITPEIKGLLFFAQRMDELLWDYSLDTNKPPALNAPYLVKEALEVLDNIDAELIEPANLKPVLEELIWAIQRDPIAKSLLDLPVEHYVLLDEATKRSEQKARLEVLGRTLERHRYLHRCLDHLCDQVKICEKKKIESTTRNLVTTLVNMGMSKRFLYQKNVEYFFSPNSKEIDSPEAIQEFLQSVYPFSHNFDVYFIATRLIHSVAESLDSFSIELLNELPPQLAAKAEEENFFCGDDEAYVKVSGIRGYDVYSAYEIATGKLDNLSDLFTLFYHKRKIQWRLGALVEQCCMDDPVLVSRSYGPMEKGFDLTPDKASTQLNRLLNNFALHQGSLEKFNRVADLHGICVTSDVVDNQLVNLWTAFETLVPSHTSGAKISNITNSIVPFMMTAYIKRLVQRFHHDLVIWNRWTTKSILNKVPGFKKPDTLLRTLALLCLDEHAVLRSELYDKIKDFELLRFRAFQLSKILSTPQKVIEALDSHELKFRWQIRRIYRTRNLIVHSGSKPTYIHTLIENGHDYLDQILFDVMKLSCGEYRTFSLEQTFELAKIKHQKFLGQLKNIQKFDTENCTFLCGDFDNLSDFMNEPWEYRGERNNAPLAPDMAPLVTATPELSDSAKLRA
jgi:hypothetical protein